MSQNSKLSLNFDFQLRTEVIELLKKEASSFPYPKDLKKAWEAHEKFLKRFPLRNNSSAIDKLSKDDIYPLKEDIRNNKDYFFYRLEHPTKALGKYGIYRNQAYENVIAKFDMFKKSLKIALDDKTPLSSKIDEKWGDIPGLGGDRQIIKKIIFMYYSDEIVPIFSSAMARFILIYMGIGDNELDKFSLAYFKKKYNDLSVGEEFELLNSILLEIKDRISRTKTWNNAYYMRFLVKMFYEKDYNLLKKEILKAGKEKHKKFWKKNRRFIKNILRDIRNLFKSKSKVNKDDIGKLNELKEKLLPEVQKIFEFSSPAGNSSEEDLIFMNDKNFRGILVAAENDDEDTIANLLPKVKFLATKTCSAWLCIFNPNKYFPVWGSKKRPGIPSPKIVEALDFFRKFKFDFDKIKDYFLFVNAVRIVAKDADVNIPDMVEVAHYLSEWGKANQIKGGKETELRSTELTLYNYFKHKNFVFPNEIVNSFYLGLKTKGFVILAGLTGSGKTKIALKFIEMIEKSVCAENTENQGNIEGGCLHKFLSVRPDWTDPKYLLGYYNPIREKYENPDMYQFINEAYEDFIQNGPHAKPYFIVLDEMNLAHVEYYFADLLSVSESGRVEPSSTESSVQKNYLTREKLKFIPDNIAGIDGVRNLELPPNLYIIGTINVDETTFTISPKVIDRAFVIEFRDINLEEYKSILLENIREDNSRSDSSGFDDLAERILNDLRKDGKFTAFFKEDIRDILKEEADKLRGFYDNLDKLNRALALMDLHFGYRVIDEIIMFLKNAMEAKEEGIIHFDELNEIFDLAVMIKIHPKFHGSIRRLEKPLLIMLLYALQNEVDEKLSELSADELFEKFKKVSGEESEGDKMTVIVKILDKLQAMNKSENDILRYTAIKCLRMLRDLYDYGFASYI